MMDYVMCTACSHESPGVFSVGPLEVASVRDHASVVTIERGLARMGRQEVPEVSLADRKFDRDLRY